MFGLIKRDLLVQRRRLWIAAVFCIMQIVLYRLFEEFALAPTVLVAVYLFGYSRTRIWYAVLLFAGGLFPCYILAKLSMEWGLSSFITGLANASEGTVAAVLFAAAVIILTASCMLSIRLYPKREF